MFIIIIHSYMYVYAVCEVGALREDNSSITANTDHEQQ